MITLRRFLSALCLILGVAAAADPVVIAHRGASGYLPEHTLAAYAMAYAQGADYLEPDLVLTADGHPVALHDLTLDATTDVRTRFPDRAREDGLHYVVDFTLAELRTLRVHERIEPDSGEMRYPLRFPARLGHFHIVTLEELLQLLAGLNHSTGREVGIYPEIKAYAFHAEEGQDFVAILLEILDRHGYAGPEARCIIQSFEPEPLIRLREEFGSELPLVQLLGENAWEMNEVDYDAMYTQRGLEEIARYADGIGPPLGRILTAGEGESPRASSLLADAQALGLLVHPYTLRADVLPPGVDFDELLTLLFAELGVDGIFTDHPDRAVAVRQQLQKASVTP